MLAEGIQSLIVTLLVTLAAGYLAYHFYRSARKGGACCPTGCHPSPKDVPHGSPKTPGDADPAAATPALQGRPFLPVEDFTAMARRHREQRAVQAPDQHPSSEA